MQYKDQKYKITLNYDDGRQMSAIHENNMVFHKGLFWTGFDIDGANEIIIQKYPDQLKTKSPKLSPIYKLFTGNYIDLSYILDITPYAVQNETYGGVKFRIEYILKDAPKEYFWRSVYISMVGRYYNFLKLTPYELKLLKEKYPDYEKMDVEGIVAAEEAEFKQLYDQFILDWKTFKEQ